MLKPLTDPEMEQLADWLLSFSSEQAMDLEELDGFFAALHCCPELIPLNDYLPEVWGDAEGDHDVPFDNIDELNAFLNLLMRYWNEVGQRFQQALFLPHLVVEEETEAVQGNAWAIGFLRGMDLADGFAAILADEEKMEHLLPILMLAHEHHEQVELRPFNEPLSNEKRQTLIALLCLGVTDIYHYFAPYRQAHAKQEREKNTIRHHTNKPGRNDPCYCGSGIKYKKCCLPLILH